MIIAFVLFNFIYFQQYFQIDNSLFFWGNVGLFVTFALYNIIAWKVSKIPGLEKTKFDAFKFYKKLTYGSDKMVTEAQDLEGAEVEEPTESGMNLRHRFLISNPNDIAKNMLIKLDPRSNPHPRLVFYRRAVYTTDFLPVGSKAEEELKIKRVKVLKKKAPATSKVKVKLETEKKETTA